MRTKEEIVARIRGWWDSDFFGVHTEDLIGFLDFASAKEFLEPPVGEERSTEIEAGWRVKELTREAVVEEIKGYLPFALDKCENHRGLSASRSLDHFRAWFWLLGDDEMLAFIDKPGNYAQYGAPIIKKVAERVGVQLDASPEFERMATGHPCGAGDCGCGW